MTNSGDLKTCLTNASANQRSCGSHKDGSAVVQLTKLSGSGQILCSQPPHHQFRSSRKSGQTLIIISSLHTE